MINIFASTAFFLGFWNFFCTQPFFMRNANPFGSLFSTQPVHLEFSQLHLLPSKPEGKVSDFLKVAPHLNRTKNLVLKKEKRSN